MDGPDMFGLECNEDASPEIDERWDDENQKKYVP